VNGVRHRDQAGEPESVEREGRFPGSFVAVLDQGRGLTLGRTETWIVGVGIQPTFLIAERDGKSGARQLALVADGESDFVAFREVGPSLGDRNVFIRVTAFGPNGGTVGYGQRESFAWSEATVGVRILGVWMGKSEAQPASIGSNSVFMVVGDWATCDSHARRRHATLTRQSPPGRANRIILILQNVFQLPVGGESLAGSRDWEIVVAGKLGVLHVAER
jgi:hypothetical protein